MGPTRQPDAPEDPRPADARSAAAIDPTLAEAIVADAIARYFAGCRERVPGFVERHFSLTGALRLHRLAIGLDILRAPANLALIAPAIAASLGGAGLAFAGARRPAAWLRDRRFFLETDVAREIAWLIYTELLILPHTQGERRAERDALAEEILADPRVAGPLKAGRAAAERGAATPEARRRLQQALAAYAGTRTATADIANTLVSLGTGALALQQLTPGAFSLGPALAAIVAQQVAIASFPLGVGLGGLWYGVFPAAPSAALIAGSTAGVMALAACLAAFSGVVTDPLQRRLGLHRRRLDRLIATLERNFQGDSKHRYVVRDHYAARLVDLFDLLAMAARLAR